MTAHCRPIGRDPFPYPKFENDNAFKGYHCTTKMDMGQFSEKCAAKEGAFKRLSSTKTLSSARHEALYYDAMAPRDDLDFLLKARYNNGDALFADKPDVCMQSETTGDDHGRVLKNRIIFVPKKEPELGHPLKVVQQDKRETIHQIKKAIVGHHTELTNKGYSRKPDGGYYQK